MVIDEEKRWVKVKILKGREKKWDKGKKGKKVEREYCIEC